MKQIKPYIIEKLKISTNNRIKEHTEIGDLFNVNIEPSHFYWEAKNFFNKTDWNKLETYLEDYPEYNKKYINIYKPSTEVQRYGECLDLLVGCILSIPYKHNSITDGRLWSTIFDYVYDNDLLDTSSISIVIDEDLGDNYRINIHHDLDNKNAYIVFYLCKK
jgi:hypothetical protein